MKAVMKFWKKGKLNPWYISPYEFLRCIEDVTYEKDVLSELDTIYQVFYVSKFKKCIGDPYLVVPIKSIWRKDNLSNE